MRGENERRAQHLYNPPRVADAGGLIPLLVERVTGVKPAWLFAEPAGLRSASAVPSALVCSVWWLTELYRLAGKSQPGSAGASACHLSASSISADTVPVNGSAIHRLHATPSELITQR